MKSVNAIALFAIVVFFSGCASFQTATEVSAGRQAFFVGNNEAALAYFQSAAQKDPTYVHGTALRQGIWSYVGRSEYATGRLPQAQKSLERALSVNREEDVARLYLGLTLARAGDRQKGLKEIEGGMRGIHDWLEYVTQAHRFTFGKFWDPRGEIRSAIQGDLRMISGRDLNWERLIADGEWLGKRIEEEGDLARRDESREMSRESEGRDSQP
jgi:tetratricopeptide (TPR) repeat protein